MNFRNALNTVTAELAPQPWDWTDEHGTTLTVVPAGLREAPGYGEVMVRVTASRTLAAEVGVTTTYMPSLLHALDTSTPVELVTNLDDSLTVTPAPDDGLVLTVAETADVDTGRVEITAAIHLPAGQRLPLAAALRRATDVARGWED